MSDKIKRDLSQLKAKVGNLLTPEEIASKMETIVPKTKNSDKNFAESENTKGRKKFTTMLAPDLIFQLKSIALEKGISAADLLENILRSHLPEKK